MWLFLTLTAAALWAVTNIIDKYVLSNRIQKPIFFLAISSIVALIFGIIFLFFDPVVFSFREYVLVFTIGFSIVLTNIAYFYAVSRDEVSRVVPLLTLDVLFVFVFASIFLNESFSSTQLIGIVALLIGGIFIHYRPGYILRFTGATFLVLVAAASTGYEVLMAKYVLSDVSIWAFAGYVKLSAFICSFPIFLYFWSTLKQYWKRDRSALFIMAGSEVLTVVAIVLFYIALTFSFATLVNVVSSTQYLFLLLFSSFVGWRSHHLIKEKVDRISFVVKLVSILFMIGGVYLVAV